MLLTMTLRAARAIARMAGRSVLPV